jgi:hypothetical protein
VKKAYFSPVTTLLMSLSLALGILVSDLSGYKLLASAHAQEGSCDGQGSTLIGSTVFVNNGVANGGIAVRDIEVNGQLVAEGVIAGSVQLVNSTVEGASGVIVGGGTGGPSGVIVGGGTGEGSISVGGSPCIDGVIVGGGTGDPSGVIVGGGTGDGNGGPSGVIVGGGNLSVGDAFFNVSGTFVGGTLTGDGITVNGGVITGQNLLLNGATIGGSINGTIGSVNIWPVN